MTLHLGNVPANSTLYIPFATYAGSTGASVTLTGLAVTDIEIYKNGSVTQRASDNGYTLLDTDGIDFDGITGIHGFSVDLSDNSDSGFYAVGSFYWVVVSSVTVDSQTVNFIAATFRIVAAEAIAGKPKVDVDGWLGTACATPSVNGVPEVDLTHVAGSTTNVSTLATNVNAILTDTADMQPKLGTISNLGSGATIGANLADIEGQTDDIGVAGAGLTALASAAALATAQADLDTITGADGVVIASGTQTFNMTGNITGNLSGSVGSVTGNVGGNVTGTIGGLTAAALKDFFDTDSTTTYASAVAGSVVKEIADNAGGSSLTAADIADAVWDEAATGHTDAGKAGAQLWTSIDAILVDTGTTLNDKIDVIDGIVDDILVDTAEIGSAGAGLTEAGGTGDQLTAVPWNAAWDDEVQSEAEDALVAHRLDELLNADSDIDGAAPPTVGSVFHELMTKTTGSFTYDQTTDSLEAIRDFDTTIKSETATILADTNELQTDWANGGRLDNILDARASQTSVDDLPTNSELAAALGTADDAVLTELAIIEGYVDAIPDDVWDEALEGSYTARQLNRLYTAALAGKLSGAATTTVNIRDTADSKNRISATVDSDGNRSSVTLDVT